MGEGDETVRAWVRRYLTELRPLTLSVRGADLLAAGVPPGPRIGEALRATRRARLDGRIDAAGELRYALDILNTKGEPLDPLAPTSLCRPPAARDTRGSGRTTARPRSSATTA